MKVSATNSPRKFINKNIRKGRGSVKTKRGNEMQSHRQKKRRSEFKKKVYERKEKREAKKPKSNKVKKLGSSGKKDDPPKKADAQSQDTASPKDSETDTNSEEEKYCDRKIESNWERYERKGEEEIKKLSLLSLENGDSESETEEISVYLTSGNSTTPDLNSLSKSPSELVEHKFVCFDDEAGHVYYSRPEDVGKDISGANKGTNKKDGLDEELDELLQDVGNGLPQTTSSHIESTMNLSNPNPSIPILPQASNTDELDSLLDDLLN